MVKTKPTYIDLFAGCGGLSLGLYYAGWKGIFAVEKSPFAFATLKHNLIDKKNHFEWPEWLEMQEMDIGTLFNDHQKELYNLRNKIDLVVGGPPCQGFSSAGRRNENDQRNDLINSYIRFIRIVQPKVIFFENVKGFTQTFQKNRSLGINYSEYVKKTLQGAGANFNGYNVAARLIDFSEFGIPQKRVRFILIGIRKDYAEKTNTSIEMIFDQMHNNRFSFLKEKNLKLNQNISDALSDLLRINGDCDSPDSKGFKTSCYGPIGSSLQNLLRNGYADKNQLPDSHRFANHSPNTVNQFKSLLNLAPRGKRLNGHEKEKFGLKKRGLTILSKDLPAPTLTSHPDDYVHYSEPRILTVREYARIQTFPDWFEFKKKYTTGGALRKVEVPRYTQIGNAIPPLFGEQIGILLKTVINV